MLDLTASSRIAESGSRRIGHFDLYWLARRCLIGLAVMALVQSTVYRWKSRHGSIGVSKVKQLRNCLVPCHYILRSRERLFLARELIYLFLEDLKE